jgi:hypothetical protein
MTPALGVSDVAKDCCKSHREGRNPKAGRRPKSESTIFSVFGFRPSFGLRGFGLRIWSWKLTFATSSIH